MPVYDFRFLFRPEHKIKKAEAPCYAACYFIRINAILALLYCTYDFVGTTSIDQTR